MTDSVLKTNSVTRRFGGLVAVEEISIDVRRGEIYGIVGPNGAGKSTLFNLIAGVLPVSTGTIEAFGSRIETLSPHRRSRLGVGRTFQTSQAFPGMTVEEALLAAMSGARHGLGAWLRSAHREDDREQASATMKLVGLSDHATRKPANLTNLELQRLAIGLALSTNAKVLLLDEPSGGLVMSEVMDLRDLIQQIRKTGVTIVVIDHKMRLMMQLCDRIMVMATGRQIAIGEPADIAQDPVVQSAYLGRSLAKGQTP